MENGFYITSLVFPFAFPTFLPLQEQLPKYLLRGKLRELEREPTVY